MEVAFVTDVWDGAIRAGRIKELAWKWDSPNGILV